MSYLGDYAADGIVDFMWSTNAADGASITRATNGTVSVYKGNSTTQSTAGITDTEDFDSLTGIHHCRINLSADAFYAAGEDYNVVLSGATIDGEAVNAVLATFSIENRYLITEEAIRSALGMASANLDDKFALLPLAEDQGTVSDMLAASGAEIVDGSVTRQEVERIVLAALAGTTTGAGTGLLKFFSPNGLVARITAVMSGKNRVSVTLDGSAEDDIEE